ncbi:unnamed protein product [Rotaria sp. Silwood2]|nr:unnamed protein product [Rotaria sp. Silwood2]CAF2790909.1 unnamed protein product [Rotaria sp. Silwood2]CAF3094833.1 unnamed protein product [Rotaria sp. Silwood2]CAF3403438.1 unnamed protein product [Rotaria sp. Silwood2]CAF3936196.1 unnamed protein product [Rotaria sp. Silwood2]
MLISLFSNMEQISFHFDTMPHLHAFLKNVPMTLSTLVIEDFIDRLPNDISNSETDEWLEDFARIHQICCEFDENKTAVV